jgi:uncharacterized protein (DUF2235 family)
MSDCKSERVNIKFVVKLKKSATETFQLLTETYGETKRQSVQWKSTSSPRPKKACMSHLKFKAMFIVFFDIQDSVMAEWVPSSQMVNQQYYFEVLTKLRECVRRKRPKLWKNRWILHQKNAPAHNTLSVKKFLAN